MSMKYTPHDELFKHVMGHPETAKNFIREYLPEDIVDKVDLSHFQDKTEKYTDEKMDEYRTDYVFRYIIAAIDLPPHLMQKIVNQEVPERREEFMAMAEKLREEEKNKFDSI